MMLWVQKMVRGGEKMCRGRTLIRRILKIEGADYRMGSFRIGRGSFLLSVTGIVLSWLFNGVIAIEGTCDRLLQR